MGGGTQGRVEHAVLDADDLRLSSLRAAAEMAEVSGASHVLCTRAIGQADAGHIAFRAAAS